MTRGDLYIPEPVKDSIRTHLAHGTAEALATYESADADEDAMTGHLGAFLTARTRSVFVDDAEVPGTWRWSLRYSKFRGRGPGAPETYVGADAVIELSVSQGSYTASKSALFQAKMAGRGGRDLLGQALRLSTWREASFVARYSRRGFSAARIDDIVRGRGGAASFIEAKPLDVFLGQDFLNCEVGDTSLQYDAHRRRLYWRDHTSSMVSTDFEVGGRFRVHVDPPSSGLRGFPAADHISRDALHLHRMGARPEEILSVERSASKSTAKAAQRSLAKAYHPDKFQDLDELSRLIAGQRMVEANLAFEELYPKGS